MEFTTQELELIIGLLAHGIDKNYSQFEEILEENKNTSFMASSNKKYLAARIDITNEITRILDKLHEQKNADEKLKKWINEMKQKTNLLKTFYLAIKSGEVIADIDYVSNN